MKKKMLGLLSAFLLSIPFVKAHCPLCTVGAAVAAGGAVYLGVNNIVVGLFIGAFAVSIGWWIGKLIKRQFIPFQKTMLIVFSFITTILPMIPLLPQSKPFYISWIGQYGLTFAVNLFLLGAIIGGLIVCITPWLSKKIASLRNGKLIPYQGIMLTLGLLIIIGTIMQLML